MKILNIHSIIRKKKYNSSTPEETNDNKLVFNTFNKAIALNPNAKPIFHSDRGFQYTSKAFQLMLKNQEMEQSMSRVGHCIDI